MRFDELLNESKASVYAHTFRREKKEPLSGLLEMKGFWRIRHWSLFPASKKSFLFLNPTSSSAESSSRAIPSFKLMSVESAIKKFTLWPAPVPLNRKSKSWEQPFRSNRPGRRLCVAALTSREPRLIASRAWGRKVWIIWLMLEK